MMDRPDIVVFDVNETLLSLGSLKPEFASVFGSDDLMGEWFARMLHGSLVSNELNHYRSFGTIGIEALLMLAAKHDIELTEVRASEVVAGMRQLAAHPDVAPGLNQLRDAGLRTATLTNGSNDAAAAQLSNAGIDHLIDETMTVESVGKFKPAAEVYEVAAEHFGVEPAQMLMVAAHDWDVAGASNAGCMTAFVSRPGVTWSLPGDPPGFVADDIPGVVAQLLS